MRWITVILLGALLGVSACSPRDDSAASADGEDVVVTKSGETWREGRLMLGRQTYELACASCHDTGKLDAPLIGNPKDWSGRSELWGAVLVEHAKTGYLEMPGKGGHEDLSEDAVEAATEYMLNVTFPEMPRD
ncbi:MAG: c-type cytochrome [Gammaproteobacteria bacterium]|nr:c-type cytochrome [Gammaproteobacteria bacterium]